MDGDGAHGYLYQVVGGALDLLLGTRLPLFLDTCCPGLSLCKKTDGDVT